MVDLKHFIFLPLCILYFGFANSVLAIETIATINTHKETVRVINKGKLIRTIQKNVTIHSRDGKSVGIPYVFYDKLISVKKFECSIFDALGNEVKKFKLSDALDESITSQGTIFDDNRIKYFNFELSQFPYTVQFHSEVEYQGVFAYPQFTPVPEYGVQVLESKFEVIFPPEIGLRYKCNFPDSLPQSRQQDGTLQVWTWQLDSIKALREEIYGPPDEMIFPMIYLVADEFEYDNVVGRMDSWSSFGKWLYSLLQDRSSLPEEEVTRIKQIASTYKSDEEKIKALYQYMQKKTRYVSIQLGIGGYRPMPVQDVSRLGYGDCKALSNYMRVILQTAGIVSYYTVIGAGKENSSFSFIDFPNPFQANHVILSVPMERDTIFLECTSQKNACGYLGTFTADRNALLVTENGGNIIRTPKYSIEENWKSTKGEYAIGEDGLLRGSVHKMYFGIASEDLIYLEPESEEEKRKSFIRKTGLNRVSIEKLDYDFILKSMPEVHESAEISIPSYAQISNDRIFFAPHLFERWNINLPQGNDRRFPIHFSEEFFEEDSILFKIPDSFELETMPGTIQWETDYGKYTSIVSIGGKNTIIFYRKMLINAGIYPSDSYAEMRTFFRNISKQDKNQLSLIRKKT